MLNFAKGLGWMIVFGFYDAASWARAQILRHPKPLSHIMLIVGAVVLTVISFQVAAFSAGDSVILFWMAIVMFVAGVKPVIGSRLLVSTNAQEGV